MNEGRKYDGEKQIWKLREHQDSILTFLII